MLLQSYDEKHGLLAVVLSNAFVQIRWKIGEGVENVQF
jgi:hypothetical protein